MHVVTVIGTRPEAIKLGPVVRELRARGFACTVIHTGQHTDLVADPFALFDIQPDIVLDTMREGQPLAKLVASLATSLTNALKSIDDIDVVVVQGDTASTMVGALAAMNLGLPVAHVEAGLRTSDPYDPFPEEVNRMVVTMATTHHFAPTDTAAANLRREGIPEADIAITGNTAVDAVKFVLEEFGSELEQDRTDAGLSGLRYVAMTLHRRESWGARMRETLAGVRDYMESDPDLHLVFPMHPNPTVRAAAADMLSGTPRVRLVEPAGYRPFIALMQGAELIVTDSGGIQEEAPSLGKHTLVLRESTERTEGISAGTATLVGVEREAVRDAIATALAAPPMPIVVNPFGDGHASERIVDVLQELYAQAL